MSHALPSCTGHIEPTIRARVRTPLGLDDGEASLKEEAGVHIALSSSRTPRVAITRFKL